mgnify:CR=1 FL=1
MIHLIKAEYMIDKDKLFQRLKIKKDSSASKVAEKTFKKLLRIIDENLELTNIYMLKEKTFKFDFYELDNCQQHVYCFSSASDKIVRKIDDLMNNKEYFEAYMVNDIVFNASAYMDQRIKQDISSKGLQLGKKAFPGENGLDFKHQKSILDLLKKNIEIDAELTESYMIKPEKSMIYVFGVGNDIEECSTEHDCALCDIKECMYRKI